MSFNKGDMLKISYTGIETASGRVFDTTLEARAKEAGLHREGARYSAFVIVVGKGDLIKGLDDEVQKMNLGEQKKITLEPRLAYGERKAEMITVVPLQAFRENKMAPFPGMVVETNGMQGRVQSVSGGRVRVDFNHPLAGKTIEFEIKVEEKISEPKKKIEALFDKMFPLIEEKDRKVAIKGEEVEIVLEKKLPVHEQMDVLKKVFEKIVAENVEGVKTVKIVEKEAAEEKKQEAGATATVKAEARAEIKANKKKAKEAKGKAKKA